MSCHTLLQGIFPTQGLNPDLLHCRWILYHLSSQESPAEQLEVSSEQVKWELLATSWPGRPATLVLLFLRDLLRAGLGCCLPRG